MDNDCKTKKAIWRISFKRTATNKREQKASNLKQESADKEERREIKEFEIFLDTPFVFEDISD